MFHRCVFASFNIALLAKTRDAGLSHAPVSPKKDALIHMQEPAIARTFTAHTCKQDGSKARTHSHKTIRAQHSHVMGRMAEKCESPVNVRHRGARRPTVTDRILSHRSLHGGGWASVRVRVRASSALGRSAQRQPVQERGGVGRSCRARRTDPDIVRLAVLLELRQCNHRPAVRPLCHPRHKLVCVGRHACLVLAGLESAVVSLVLDGSTIRSNAKSRDQGRWLFFVSTGIECGGKLGATLHAGRAL